jgi:nucleoside-triphosphatase
MKAVPYKHKVGKYSVYIEDFEKMALPIFATANTIPLIIDEIGRMELLSVKFEIEINQLILDIKSNKKILIATVPSSQRGRTIPVVEELKAITKVKHFEITKGNRTAIYQQILNDSKEMLKHK